MERYAGKLVIGAILLVVGSVLFFKTFSFVKVEGSEAVVLQDLISGVKEEVWRDGTHFYIGWITDPYKYNIGTQKITFDEAESNPEAEYPRIVVDVGENGGQKVYVALSVNYRPGWRLSADGNPEFSSEALVKLHKDGLGQSYENVILKRTIVEVVNQLARPRQALAIYSGEGYVKFANDLDDAIKAHPSLLSRGIFVENTILYKVYLDPAYEREIASKQLAIQTTLRKTEETKAAEQEARRAFAEAQANVEQRRQEAEAKKIEQVKNAEAQAEKEVLAAEADKKRRILQAEGEQGANLARASGILAVGKAEAEVAALQREALYGGRAGEWRAKVQISELQASKLSGLLKGVRVINDKTLQMLYDDSARTPAVTISDMERE